MNSKVKKETIVFVHGAWHGKWCWDKYFRKIFTTAGYDVITFDLPGHSVAGKIKGMNKYSISDYTNALKKEVGRLKEAPIIIGHSMGGWILQNYLESATCKKAIFLASVPPYGVFNTTLKFARKSYFYPSLLGLNLYGLVNSTSKSRNAFFSKSLPTTELEEYTSKLCSESFKAFLNMIIPKRRVNANAKIPILVIGAREDTIFSVEDNKKTAKKYKADLIILEDIAHDMMLEVNHQKVAEQILLWLRE